MSAKQLQRNGSASFLLSHSTTQDGQPVAALNKEARVTKSVSLGLDTVRTVRSTGQSQMRLDT